MISSKRLAYSAQQELVYRLTESAKRALILRCLLMGFNGVANVRIDSLIQSFVLFVKSAVQFVNLLLQRKPFWGGGRSVAHPPSLAPARAPINPVLAQTKGGRNEHTQSRQFDGSWGLFKGPFPQRRPAHASASLYHSSVSRFSRPSCGLACG